MAKAWAHLHLPRWRAFSEAGGTSEVISIKTPGRRVSYTSAIVLKDCTFFVSAKGRERCLKSGVRNVHAWVIGDIIYVSPNELPKSRRAIYDPWKGGTFVDADTLQPIEHADLVYMVGKDVYYEK